jgi:hypothetical protein
MTLEAEPYQTISTLAGRCLEEYPGVPSNVRKFWESLVKPGKGPQGRINRVAEELDESIKPSA